MSQAWLRVAGGVAAFAVVAIIGIAGLAGGDADLAARSWTIVAIVAVPAGVAAYALVEYLQTRRFDSITRQFDTRTVVLIPVAMALNIVLGTVVASVLKLPIYLDSIGTILVAALAGPLAGALTGFLSNLVWTYLAPPPFQSLFAAPFAVVAFVIGLLAGTFARWGWLRPRRDPSPQRLVAAGVAAVALLIGVAVLAQGFVGDSSDTPLQALGWLAVVLVFSMVVVLIALLAWKRDLAAAWLVVAGAVTGIVAAFSAAPIAAVVFGGVTGSGTDLLVAAFRQTGANVQEAVLGQALISDPIDKVITYFVVYLILGAMSVRTLARFPQGQHLLPREPTPLEDDPPGVDEGEVAR